MRQVPLQVTLENSTLNFRKTLENYSEKLTTDCDFVLLGCGSSVDWSMPLWLAKGPHL